MQITVVEHPLIKAKLTQIRDVNTDTVMFKRILDEIAMLLIFEVTKDLPLEKISVTTPLTETEGYKIAGSITVVPILRAGLGFLSSATQLIPEANVGHIGMSRNEETLEPMEYYCKMPKDKDAYTIVLDPMLATGGSAAAAIEQLKKRGMKNIRFMCLVAAPEGVKRINEAHPDVKIFTAALDDHLNEHGYIVPGLGDAGDRIFGTI